MSENACIQNDFPDTGNIDYRKHAEGLSDGIAQLIRRLLIKHDAVLLQELHSVVKELNHKEDVMRALEDRNEMLTKEIDRLRSVPTNPSKAGSDEQ